MTLFKPALFWLLITTAAQAGDFRLAVTTSFQNSGLADAIIPLAEADLQFEIDVFVAGTGRALRLGQAGDVDAVLVHAPAAEADFIAAGHAPYRRQIMYNTFVLVGPADDPAGIAAATNAAHALRAIADARAPFVSRGDESGTHLRELAVWDAAGRQPDGTWYRSVGAGMGTALNIAVGMGAYILTDKASWLNFANQSDLAVLFEGDPALINQYAYLPLTAAAADPDTAARSAAVEAWLTSDRGQAAIGAYVIGATAVFVPNALAN
ncbi:MAG: substrate-binding domain-containing protein [Pseudomonadota bacterium]